MGNNTTMQMLVRRNRSRIRVQFGNTTLTAIGMLLLATPATFAQSIYAHAGDGFVSRTFPSQTSVFTAEFDAIPDGTNNAGIGMADNPQLGYAGTSTFVRFNPSGNIDARNGANFAAAAAIPYHSGLTYHFREDVDVLNAVYTISVRLPGKASNPFTVVGKN